MAGQARFPFTDVRMLFGHNGIQISISNNKMKAIGSCKPKNK